MKNIVDIYEKLSIDDICVSDDFPIKGSFDDTVSFLEAHRFSKYENVGPTFSIKKKKLEEEKGKAFIISMGIYNNVYIRFADTSHKHISEENPIFLIEFNNNKKNFSIEYKTWREKDVSEKEFLSKLNKTILF